MTYQASMDETRTPFDVVVYDQDGVTLLADRNSAGYLHHLDVDYSDDLVSMGFRFSNPNATKAWRLRGQLRPVAADAGIGTAWQCSRSI